jgi:hypothetical protein
MTAFMDVPRSDSFVPLRAVVVALIVALVCVVGGEVWSLATVPGAECGPQSVGDHISYLALPIFIVVSFDIAVALAAFLLLRSRTNAVVAAIVGVCLAVTVHVSISAWGFYRVDPVAFNRDTRQMIWFAAPNKGFEFALGIREVCT